MIFLSRYKLFPLAFIILVILALFFKDIYGQSSVIKNIRQAYYAINKNMGSFRVVEKVLSGYSAEGASLKIYRQNNHLKKIYVKYFGETGFSVSEYYFKNGNIIFYYNLYVKYNMPYGIKGGKVIFKKEERLYFHQGKLIKWLGQNNKIVPYNKKRYRKKYRKIRSDIKEFLVAEKLKKRDIHRNEILEILNE